MKYRKQQAKVIRGEYEYMGRVGEIIQEPLCRHVVIRFPGGRAITIALDKLELQSQTVCAQT